MATEKKKVYPKFVTPAGTAVYPWLSKADEYKGKKSFRTGVLLPADAEVKINGEMVDLKSYIDDMVDQHFSETKAALEEQLEEAKGDKKAKLKKSIAELKKAYPYKPAVDDDGEETGEFIYSFKTAAEYKDKKTDKMVAKELTIVDAKKNPVTESVYGGSIIKVSGEIATYHNPSSDSAGVNFYLRGVQVLELVSGSGNAANDFDEEEGYTSVSSGGGGGSDASDEDDDF